MSKETSQWLNTHTLIGFTDKRGTAWHYRAEDQGAESNHYAGAIPLEDVRRRLFYWEAAEGVVQTSYLTPDGVSTITDPERKSMCRPVGTYGPDDEGAILGLFKSGYRQHTRDQWLVENVETIIGQGLSIASVGELKSGAVAWVQVEMPETAVAEGFEFRAFLTAATSLDGSLATTYLTGAQAVVCDNTLSAALGDTGALRLKVKHSRNSLSRVPDVQAALGIVAQTTEAFAAQVTELCSVGVSDAQWRAFLDAHAPLTDKGQLKSGRSLTMAQNERDSLNRLWRHDVRVSPWAGTAFGVVQAVNTYTHHEGIVRGAGRAERNQLRAVTGGVDALDTGTLRTLAGVLAAV